MFSRCRYSRGSPCDPNGWPVDSRNWSVANPGAPGIYDRLPMGYAACELCAWLLHLRRSTDDWLKGV